MSSGPFNSSHAGNGRGPAPGRPGKPPHSASYQNANYQSSTGHDAQYPKLPPKERENDYDPYKDIPEPTVTNARHATQCRADSRIAPPPVQQSSKQFPTFHKDGHSRSESPGNIYDAEDEPRRNEFTKEQLPAEFLTTEEQVELQQAEHLRTLQATNAPRNDLTTSSRHPSRQPTIDDQQAQVHAQAQALAQSLSQSQSQPQTARRPSTYDIDPLPTSALVRTLRTESELYKAEVLSLRRTVASLEDSLKDAQDFIFSLQPHHTRLTETEATAEFSALCTFVEDFVDKKLGDALEERALVNGKERLPERGVSRSLLKHVAVPGWEAFSVTGTDEANVRSAVMLFLCQRVFYLEFFVPLPRHEQEFLQGVEKAMRNLEPRRDLRTRRTYRSETYTALIARPDFPPALEARKRELTEELSDMLRILAPNKHRKDFTSSLRERIIEPAFALAQKMHLSVDEFALEWSLFHNLRAGERGQAQFPGDFSEFESFDVAALMPLKNRPEYSEYLFDINPRLVLRSVKTDTLDEPKVLKKRQILVMVPDKHGRSVERRRPEDATVLGWLREVTFPPERREGGRGMLHSVGHSMQKVFYG